MAPASASTAAADLTEAGAARGDDASAGTAVGGAQPAEATGGNGGGWWLWAPPVAPPVAPPPALPEAAYANAWPGPDTLPHTSSGWPLGGSAVAPAVDRIEPVSSDGGVAVDGELQGGLSAAAVVAEMGAEGQVVPQDPSGAAVEVGHEGDADGGDGRGAGGAAAGTAAGAVDSGRDEGGAVGRVQWSVYARWVEAAGGLGSLALGLAPLLLAELLTVAQPWWLTRWARAATAGAAADAAAEATAAAAAAAAAAASTDAAAATAAAFGAAASLRARLPRGAGYLIVYTCLALAAAALAVLRSRLLLGLGVVAGSRLHDAMLARVVRAPLAFFDVTPTGRVLTRLSRDLHVADLYLPAALQSLGATVVSVASSLLVVCASAPAIVLPLLPATWCCRAAQRLYAASARELRRLEAGARSPLLSQVTEASEGLATIRAYGASRRFEAAYYVRLDASLQASLAAAVAGGWLGLRLEVLSAAVASLFAALCFAQRHAPLVLARLGALLGAVGLGPLGGRVARAAERSAAGGGGGGGGGGGAYGALGLALVLQATQALTWSVRQACELEAHLVAVERLQAYEAVPPEPGYAVLPPPPEHWGDPAAPAAAHGTVELRNVSLRYRDGLPLVLRGVSATIRAREKVGVVGRTGSGKSSLLAAITQLVAPPQRTGAILVGGVEVSELPLQQHRAALAVIPQELHPLSSHALSRPLSPPPFSAGATTPPQPIHPATPPQLHPLSSASSFLGANAAHGHDRLQPRPRGAARPGAALGGAAARADGARRARPRRRRGGGRRQLLARPAPAALPRARPAHATGPRDPRRGHLVGRPRDRRAHTAHCARCQPHEHIGLQPLLHVVAASGAWGCGL